MIGLTLLISKLNLGFGWVVLAWAASEVPVWLQVLRHLVQKRLRLPPAEICNDDFFLTPESETTPWLNHLFAALWQGPLRSAIKVCSVGLMPPCVYQSVPFQGHLKTLFNDQLRKKHRFLMTPLVSDLDIGESCPQISFIHSFSSSTNLFKSDGQYISLEMGIVMDLDLNIRFGVSVATHERNDRALFQIRPEPSPTIVQDPPTEQLIATPALYRSFGQRWLSIWSS